MNQSLKVRHQKSCRDSLSRYIRQTEAQCIVRQFYKIVIIPAYAQMRLINSLNSPPSKTGQIRETRYQLILNAGCKLQLLFHGLLLKHSIVHPLVLNENNDKV